VTPEQAREEFRLARNKMVWGVAKAVLTTVGGATGQYFALTRAGLSPGWALVVIAASLGLVIVLFLALVRRSRK
jgi:hypothetical protein